MRTACLPSHLSQAVEAMDLELLDFLLDQPGGNALGRDKHGCTLMHWAVTRIVSCSQGQRCPCRSPAPWSPSPCAAGRWRYRALLASAADRVR